MREHFLLGLAWLGYGVLHSLLATTGVKAFLAARLGDKRPYYRVAYNVVALGLLVPLCLWLVRMPSPFLWQPMLAQQALALLVTMLGLVGMGLCVKKYFLTTQGFRDLYYEDGEGVLLEDGLHRFVRHPLYLATFVFLWGLFLAWPRASMLVTCVVITGYTLVGTYLEERKLVAMFGQAYEDYRARVPRIVPRFSRGRRSS